MLSLYVISASIPALSNYPTVITIGLSLFSILKSIISLPLEHALKINIAGIVKQMHKINVKNFFLIFPTFFKLVLV